MNKITILSTFAKDKLIRSDGTPIRENLGGPAFFIENVFRKEKTTFIIEEAPEMEVEILVTDKGEFGKAKKQKEPQSIEFSRIKTPDLMISTILDDFDLKGIQKYEGRAFLDIQGYVRDGEDFGKKKNWNPGEKISNSIFCAKGTKEEASYLSAEFVSSQKEKLLIITDGERGCDVFAFGGKYKIKPAKIIKSENTIGAGDTFFAYFISRFIESSDPLESAQYAAQKTSEFLSESQNHHDDNLFLEEIGRD